MDTQRRAVVYPSGGGVYRARDYLTIMTVPMQKTHPHAVATYRVIPRDDGSFGVEVSIPESYPTTVTKFASEAEADAWIVRHRDRVNAEGQSGRWFRKTGRPGP